MEATGEVDLNEQLEKHWGKLLETSQKEANLFLGSSQKKVLDGSTLFAFFNKKLVSFQLNLSMFVGYQSVLC